MEPLLVNNLIHLSNVNYNDSQREVFVNNYYFLLNKYECQDAVFYYYGQLIYVSTVGIEFFTYASSYVKIRKNFVVLHLMRKANRAQFLEYQTGFENRFVFFLPFNWFTRNVIFYGNAGNVYTGTGYYKIYSVGYTPISWIQERAPFDSYADPLSIQAVDRNNVAIPIKNRSDGYAIPNETATFNIIFPRNSQLLLVYNTNSLKGVSITDEGGDYTCYITNKNDIRSSQLTTIGSERLLCGNANVIKGLTYTISSDTMPRQQVRPFSNGAIFSYEFPNDPIVPFILISGNVDSPFTMYTTDIKGQISRGALKIQQSSNGLQYVPMSQNLRTTVLASSDRLVIQSLPTKRFFVKNFNSVRASGFYKMDVVTQTLIQLSVDPNTRSLASWMFPICPTTYIPYLRTKGGTMKINEYTRNGLTSLDVTFQIYVFYRQLDTTVLYERFQGVERLYSYTLPYVDADIASNEYIIIFCWSPFALGGFTSSDFAKFTLSVEFDNLSFYFTGVQDVVTFNMGCTSDNSSIIIRSDASLDRIGIYDRAITRVNEYDPITIPFSQNKDLQCEVWTNSWPISIDLIAVENVPFNIKTTITRVAVVDPKVAYGAGSLDLSFSSGVNIFTSSGTSNLSMVTLGNFNDYAVIHQNRLCAMYVESNKQLSGKVTGDIKLRMANEYNPFSTSPDILIQVNDTYLDTPAPFVGQNMLAKNRRINQLNGVNNPWNGAPLITFGMSRPNQILNIISSCTTIKVTAAVPTRSETYYRLYVYDVYNGKYTYNTFKVIERNVYYTFDSKIKGADIGYVLEVAIYDGSDVPVDVASLNAYLVFKTIYKWNSLWNRAIMPFQIIKERLVLTPPPFIFSQAVYKNYALYTKDYTNMNLFFTPPNPDAYTANIAYYTQATINTDLKKFYNYYDNPNMTGGLLFTNVAASTSPPFVNVPIQFDNQYTPPFDVKASIPWIPIIPSTPSIPWIPIGPSEPILPEVILTDVWTPPNKAIYNISVVLINLQAIPISTGSYGEVTFTLPATVDTDQPISFYFAGRPFLEKKDFDLVITTTRNGVLSVTYDPPSSIDVLFLAKPLFAGCDIELLTSNALYDASLANKNVTSVVSIGQSFYPKIDTDLDWLSLSKYNDIEIVDKYVDYQFWQLTDKSYKTENTNFITPVLADYKSKRQQYYTSTVIPQYSNNLIIQTKDNNLINGIRLLKDNFNITNYLNRGLDILQCIVYNKTIIWSTFNNETETCYVSQTLKLPLQMRDFKWVAAYAINSELYAAIKTDTLVKKWADKIQVLWMKNETGAVVMPKRLQSSVLDFTIYLCPLVFPLSNVILDNIIVNIFFYQ